MTTTTYENENVNEISQILDKLLVNNEVNLISHILGFLTEKCNECEEEIIPTIENLMDDIGECVDGCKKKCDSRNTVLCLDCIQEFTCKGCDEPIYTCDNEELRYCNDENCDNKFCEECYYDYVIPCGDCGDAFCCRKFYRFDAGEREYRCEDCVKIIHPQF